MGIIQKQSINSSIFILIGFAIGALNILVLFPKFLTPDQFGLTRAMMDISLTLATLGTLGSLTVIYKFSPFYSDYLKDKNNDLPFITGAISLMGFLLILGFGFGFRDLIIRKLGKSPDFANFFYTVYPYTLFLLIFSWLEAFAWSAKKTVFTNFLRETVVRLISTLLILLYGFNVIELDLFINLFSLLYFIPSLILLKMLTSKTNWSLSIINFSSVTRRLKKRMIVYGLFVFGAQFLNVLSRTNDSILVIGLLGLADTAVFSIASYFIAVMEIPQRSMNSISLPVLAEAWKNKDKVKIESIYRKSVINLLVIGLGLFGLIILNVHDVIQFLGKDYADIEAIILLMGLAKVLDLGTGINSQIIATSNFWRFDFYTNIIYTLLSLPLNFYLIKYFGLIGLAYSSLISISIYNSMRFVFIYKKFGFQPYTLKALLAIIISVIAYWLVYIIPQQSNAFLDIFLRSSAFILSFVTPMYFLNIAPDLNGIVDKFKRQVFALFP
ncbi:MAG: polysaccharide biosynthesis C-terminal domain-containing protein [Chitinophagaceae bacterium]